MKLLLDTQSLPWAACLPERLSKPARELMEDIANDLAPSPASLRVVVIKRVLYRPEFRADPRILRRGLIESGYAEMAVTSEHVLAVEMLPQVHNDPCDGLLVAQVLAEGGASGLPTGRWRDMRGLSGWFDLTTCHGLGINEYGLSASGPYVWDAHLLHCSLGGSSGRNLEPNLIWKDTIY